VRGQSKGWSGTPWHLDCPAGGGYPAPMLGTYPKSTRRWPRYQVNLPVGMLVRKPGLFRTAHVRGQELNAGGWRCMRLLSLGLATKSNWSFPWCALSSQSS